MNALTSIAGVQDQDKSPVRMSSSSSGLLQAQLPDEAVLLHEAADIHHGAGHASPYTTHAVKSSGNRAGRSFCQQTSKVI